MGRPERRGGQTQRGVVVYCTTACEEGEKGKPLRQGARRTQDEKGKNAEAPGASKLVCNRTERKKRNPSRKKGGREKGKRKARRGWGKKLK